jgi:WD40 repeat protein
VQFNRLIVGLLTTIVSISASAQAKIAQENALFPIEQNSKWGYIDRDGKTVIEPKFDSAGEFSEGLAAVEIDGKWGFVDQNGKSVIEPRYSRACEFSEGFARIQIGGDKYGLYGKWGFIDHTGRIVIEPQYGDLNGVAEAAYGFHDGLAMIEINGKKGFIDKTGTIVITPQFAYAYPFSEGLASVSAGVDQKWGYIDTSGKWAIPPKFDWGSLFSEGLAPVTLGRVCAYVDRTGELKLKPKFKSNEDDCAAVWGRFDGGLSRWKLGDKYGFINKNGDVVIKPEFDLTFNFSEGMAFVEENGKFGFINQTGQMAIEPQFYYAKDFHNGLARVSYARDGWGYINQSGEFVWKTASAGTVSDEASSFVQAGHTRDLLFVGWSPDGNFLASYSAGDGWIKIWDPRNGKLIWDVRATSLKPDRPLKSPDGTLLASGTRDVSYEIRDARSGNVIWNIKAHGTSDERVTSPNHDLIAERGSYGDACVRIIDAKTNQLIRRLEGHPGIVCSIAFSPNGEIIASGNGDRTIKFWDAQTGKLLKILFGHKRKITSLAFSADAKTLVSGSEDDTLKIWDVNDGRLVRTITAYSSGVDGITSIAFSPDGRTVLAGSGTQIKAWESATGKQFLTLETHESHTSGDPGGMQITWCCGSKARSVAVSSDGTLIVSAHEDGTIKVWDAGKGELIRIIKGRFPDLRAAVFSPGGKFIATGYDEGESRIDLWTVQNGKLAVTLGEDSDYVRSLSFSNDGRMIVSGHMSDDLKLWDAKTGKLIRQFKQPFSEDDQVAFSPDGGRIVSGGENGNVMLWDVHTGKLIWSVIPIDWEAEKRAEEEAQKEAKASAVLEVERKRVIREADKEAAAWEKQVAITFEHFGEPINPLEQHMMEKGEPRKSLMKQSAAEANGVWLKLRNNSPLPISFRTDSAYLPRPNCGFKLTSGLNGPGLCDGAEISIQYQIEEADGKRVPYGLDMSFETVLPPGASVLFSVARVYLENGRTIFIGYSYLKENEKHELEECGSPHRVIFRRSQLPQ